MGEQNRNEQRRRSLLRREKWTGGCEMLGSELITGCLYVTSGAQGRELTVKSPVNILYFLLMFCQVTLLFATSKNNIGQRAQPRAYGRLRDPSVIPTKIAFTGFVFSLYMKFY